MDPTDALPLVTGYLADGPPDLRARATRERLTPAALLAMSRLAVSWELTAAETTRLLGGISKGAWRAWQHTPPSALDVDQLTRISLLLGIYTGLHQLHPGPLADEWVRRQNVSPLFTGRTPLAALMDGGIAAMVEVRALLGDRIAGL